ncbi:gamma-glutamylcyclotransferase [Patescibacteria group bacterium]|nr:gamma-glutamylcyclotransferase [Patescibacteria group bacterium]
MNNFRTTVLALALFVTLIFIFEYFTNPGPSWLRLGALLFLGSMFLAVYIADKLKLEQEPKQTFLYFAYGSNMCTKWLRDKCPSARSVGLGMAENYLLVFTKLSKDGSGKAAIEKRGHSHTYGTVFEVNESERVLLDRAEGAGYESEHIWIWMPSKQHKERVVTYFTKEKKKDLLPYDWYLALIIKGAKQNGLPQEYIASLEKQKNTEDNDINRDTRKKALLILEDNTD